MKNIHDVRKVNRFFKYPCMKVACSHHRCKQLFSSFFSVIITLNPFWIQLGYFGFVSLAGYLALRTSPLKTESSFRPKDIDIFFTAVSAATISSMSTLDMEVFSNTQLLILVFLMFVGGEVFVSMLGLQFRKFKHGLAKSDYTPTIPSLNSTMELGIGSSDVKPCKSCDQEYLKYNGLRSLGYVVLGYILVVHFICFLMTYIYISYTPSTRRILTNKGLSRQTFSLFTVVSTFANCGFLPTNENMTVFQKNTGLLLILIPQILLGNTLYPVALQAVILTLEKTTKRVEFSYVLKNFMEMGYDQLLSTAHSCYLLATVFGLILVQLVAFCCIEWYNVETMGGLNAYEKVVGSLFQVVNARYTGEAVFDLSKLSPAILVAFVFMMYLPPLTTYLPIENHENISCEDEKNQRRDPKKSRVDYLLFSQLAYLVLFTILICLTERKKINTDPLNFNVLNITFEVISAYGNVGLSTSYSCEKQLRQDGHCKAEWYGFVGRWSNHGKVVLILVMFFGRLKSFNKNGGRFWKK